MNRYGAMAWDHWERYLPSRVEAMSDPVNFFRDLGEFVEAEVTAEMLVRLDPRDASDPDRLAMLRREVEEELLPIYVLLPAEGDEEPMEYPDADLVEEIPIAFDDPIVERLRRSPIIKPGMWEPPPP